MGLKYASVSPETGERGRRGGRDEHGGRGEHGGRDKHSGRDEHGGRDERDGRGGRGLLEPVRRAVVAVFNAHADRREVVAQFVGPLVVAGLAFPLADVQK